ncbi:hypothetical protein BDR26DRAFT_855260, partial [Obelidium mucronatum]
MTIEFPPTWITRISFGIPFMIVQIYGIPIVCSTEPPPAITEPASFSTIQLPITLLPCIAAIYLIYRLHKRIFAFEFFPWNDQQKEYFDKNKTAFDSFLKWIHYESIASFECFTGASVTGGILFFTDKGSMELVPLIVRCFLWAFVVLYSSLVVIFWRLFLHHTRLYNSLHVDN